uniref:Uncharacterized protein n=1 Tax=Anguilla anguilla TaxID=7936 RepID=A0A0E9SLU5_ANGAN
MWVIDFVYQIKDS